MTDKMTIDELELILAEHSRDSADEYRPGVHLALGVIKTHRAALEKGMRGTLRFRIRSCKTYQWAKPYKLELHEGISGLGIIGKQWYEHSVDARDYAIRIAESLNLDAEFLEADE